jgi:hypothetical protein
MAAGAGGDAMANGREQPGRDPDGAGARALELLRKTFFSPLTGLDAADWWALLRENRFAVDPGCWPRAGLITLGSLDTRLGRLQEERAYGPAVASTEIQPPLFVLGHWRSGTTHLHRLFALDEQFTSPNLFQVWHPHTFLTAESRRARLTARVARRGRFMDQMAMAVDVAAEDEEALGLLSRCVPTPSRAVPTPPDLP